jgi:hypothetical protein
MKWYTWMGLALLALALVIGQRLYKFSTWLKDVGGPKREDWLMGMYADFTVSRVDRVIDVGSFLILFDRTER